MFTSLEITNFRAFQSLKIDGLRRINIFGGKNSAGKTCFLEACELLLAPEPLRPAFQNRRRGIIMLPSTSTEGKSEVDDPWGPLFHRSPANGTVSIQGIWKGDQVQTELSTRFQLNESNQTVLLAKQNPAVLLSLQQWHQAGRILRIKTTLNGAPAEALVYPSMDGSWNWSYNLAPYVPVACVWAQVQESEKIEDQFGQILREGRESRLVDCLKNLLPDLQQLIAIPKNDRSTIYAAFGNGDRYPVSILGDGIMRVLRILLAGLAWRGGIWLIDEIENGIHYSVLPDVWRTIVETAKSMDKQVFCTTHSQEMVVTAMAAGGEDVRYFRIDALADHHEAVDYSQAAVVGTIEMELDIR